MRVAPVSMATGQGTSFVASLADMTANPGMIEQLQFQLFSERCSSGLRIVAGEALRWGMREALSHFEVVTSLAMDRH